MFIFWQKPVQWEAPEQDVYLYGDPVQKGVPGQAPSQVGTAVDLPGSSSKIFIEKDSKTLIYCTVGVGIYHLVMKLSTNRIVPYHEWG